MRFSDLADATRDFQIEVEREAVRLIQEGDAAPYDAVDRARRIVMERRQRERLNKR